MVFKDKKAIKHPANESVCRIDVNRIHGCDGLIKCKYRTIELDKTERTAIAGKHYTHVSGTLEFPHNAVKATIEIPILQVKDEAGNDVTERDEIFSIKLESPSPEIVKISKKDTLMIEIVTDDEQKKQSESLQ